MRLTDTNFIKYFTRISFLFTAIDLCEIMPNPCNGNGRCYDRQGDYKCVCDPGFTGRDCETGE